MLKTKKKISEKYEKQSENHGVSPEERKRVYGGNDLWKRYVLKWKWESEL